MGPEDISIASNTLLSGLGVVYSIIRGNSVRKQWRDGVSTSFLAFFYFPRLDLQLTLAETQFLFLSSVLLFLLG